MTEQAGVMSPNVKQSGPRRLGLQTKGLVGGWLGPLGKSHWPSHRWGGDRSHSATEPSCALGVGAVSTSCLLSRSGRAGKVGRAWGASTVWAGVPGSPALPC